MSIYRKLFSASVLVVCLGLLANLVGLAKEQLVAYFFGVGDELDVFIMGLTLPMLVSGLIGSSVTTAVIPGFLAAQKNGDEARFLLEVGGLLLFLVLLAIVGCVVAGVLLMPLLAQGFSSPKMAATISLVVALSPIILLQSLCALLDGVLNVQQRYVFTTFSNALIPFGTVILLLLWSPGGVLALCVGLYVGYFLKAILLVIALPRSMRVKPQQFLQWQATYVRHKILIREFFFLLFSSAILGLLPVIGQAYAASLPAGSVASLNYASRVLGVGMAVVSGAINAIILPALAKQQLESAHKAVGMGTRLAMFSAVAGLVFMVPAYWLLEPTVRLLFERGAFVAENTSEVAGLLAYYLPYVPLYVAGLILARVVVSIGASRVFIVGNFISLILYWAACELLVRRFGLQGIAMALSLVYLVSFVYLHFSIRAHIRVST